MNIDLADNWQLKTDSHQFMLVEKRKNKMLIRGHYSTLEAAINGFIDLKVKGSDATSISSLIQYIKTLEISLNRALNPLRLKVVSSDGANIKEHDNY